MTDVATVARKQPVVLSVVIPFYDEALVLPQLIGELTRILAPAALTNAGITAVDYVFVDDGSRDNGAAILAQALASGQLRGSLLRLSRNFGHQAALAAGVDHANGDVVMIIDADLQDDPQHLFAMLGHWRAGFDVVYGVRSRRKENVLKRFAYQTFYAILHFLSEGLIPKDSGDFGLVDRKVILAVRSMGETIRIFRGLRAFVGFAQKEQICERNSRAGGAPKYTFRKLYRLATDGIISSSIRPLMITEVVCVVSMIAAAVGAVIVAGKILTLSNPAEVVLLGYFALLAILLLGACTLMGLYMMSAYLGRMFVEVKGRPVYVIATRLDS